MKGLWYKAAAATFLVVGLIFYSANGSENAPAEQDVQKLTMVRVGRHYINLQHISYASIENDSVTLVFNANPTNAMILTGVDAQVMRQWLDRVASSVRLPPPAPVHIPPSAENQTNPSSPQARRPQSFFPYNR